MTGQLYVATDAHGVQRVDELEIVWALPEGGTPGAPSSAAGIVLLDATGLLDELGERIFTAAADPAPVAEPDTHRYSVAAARLVAETAWDVEVAARLALDCAEHVLGDAADAVLPGGSTLAQVIAEARAVLERSSDHAERRLGTLARLSAARRLKRTGEMLGDVAFGTLHADLDADIDALDDPGWATIATTRDAVLGAVEAVRHLALPRYVQARERAFEEASDEAEGERELPAGMIMTPWGPITLGAEHQSGFAPAWVAARDAVSRARDALAARGGDVVVETSWQAARLETLLS